MQLTESLYTISVATLDVDVVTAVRRSSVEPSNNEIDHGELVSELRTMLSYSTTTAPQSYEQRLDNMCQAMFVIDVMIIDLLVHTLLPQYWYATGRLRHVDFEQYEEWLPQVSAVVYAEEIYV